MSRTNNRLKMPAGFVDMNAESMEYGGSGDFNWKEITAITIGTLGLVVGIVGAVITYNSSPKVLGDKDATCIVVEDEAWATRQGTGALTPCIPCMSTAGKVGIGMTAIGGVMALGGFTAYGTGMLRKS